MLWRLLALAALSCVPVACSPSSAPAAAAPPKHGDLPSDLAAEVRQAERLGRAIFEQDLAASRAGDALVEALSGEPDARIRGFISRREAGRWRVQFFGGERGQGLSSLWEAQVGAFGAGVSLSKLDPPRPLDAEGERMARARLTAAAQPFLPCSSRYDIVIVPASEIGQEGFLVYLLASTANEGEWIVGGHQRFLISADGSSVLAHQALSKGCLAVPASRRRAGSASGAWVTHIVSDAPTETHVFLSLMHQSTLFVGTRRGTWRVAGEKISFEG